LFEKVKTKLYNELQSARNSCNDDRVCHNLFLKQKMCVTTF